MHVGQHVAGNISVNSALTAWLACVCDHVNNFGRDRKARGRSEKKVRNKRKTCHSVAFLNAALTQFSPKRERKTHVVCIFSNVNFYFIFIHNFVSSVLSGYLSDSRLNLAPCLWENESSSCGIRFSFPNVGKQSLWRSKIE